MKKLLTLTSSIVLGSVMLSLAAGALSATPAGTGATARVSVSSGGVQGNRASYPEGISANGRYLALSSEATNLVAGDTNGRADAFVRDLRTGRTTRVSVSSGGRQAKPGPDAFGGSGADGISANGRYVIFHSDASNLVSGDTNHTDDVFVHDRKTGRTTRVSVGSDGRQANGSSGFATISANGRYVAFSSMASNLVAGDTNRLSDVFVRDLATGKTRRVSVSSRGRQARCNLNSCESTEPALSADGRYVAFVSSATNLVPGDTNRLADVFLRDLRTGKTRRVSVSSRGGQGTGDPTRNGSNAPSISADGRYVAFHSADSNLVPADTNRTFDIFVNDRVTGQTRRVSIGSGGEQANGENLGALGISPDGHYVAFSSLASNLVAGDVNDITDVFVRDLRTGRTILVSLSSGGEQGDDGSWISGGVQFSANNRYLAFASWAKNLVPGDSNRSPDAFVRDFGGPPTG
jgi:Tol biopolymer transport system component